MNRKQLLGLVFGLLALVQLAVPAGMIRQQEDVLARGQVFKFRAAPVDPSDPFRGKYITLQFRPATLALPQHQGWQSNEKVYVHLARDPAGFARIRQVSRRPPAGQDYVRARIGYAAPEGRQTILFIQYPFDRYYMEESKAFPAEQAYAAALQDSSQVTYALVAIKAGEAVLKDVLIGGIPIREKVLASRPRP